MKITAIEGPKSRQKEQASFLVTVAAVGIMVSMLRLLSKALRLVEAAFVCPKEQGRFA
jgi:uncharacterized membrane protein